MELDWGDGAPSSTAFALPNKDANELTRISTNAANDALHQPHQQLQLLSQPVTASGVPSPQSHMDIWRTDPPVAEHNPFHHAQTPATLAQGRANDAEAKPAVPSANFLPLVSEVNAAVLQHPLANRRVVLEKQALGYLLQRRRRRTVGMHITAQGLEVHAPAWVGVGEIERILQDKSRWIVRKLREQAHKNQEQQQLRPTWQNGMYLPWRGGLLQLALTAPAQTDADAGTPLPPARLRKLLAAAQLQSLAPHHAGSVAQEADTPPAVQDDSRPTQQHIAPGLATHRLLLDLPANASGARVQQSVGGWMQQQALEIFTQRLNHYAPMLGVRWQALKLSQAQGSWGCATSRGTIRLHWRLVQMPADVLDYVVVHELAHLREMNHSPRFWALVEHILPDYRQRQFQLKRTVLAPW